MAMRSPNGKRKRRKRGSNLHKALPRALEREVSLSAVSKPKNASDSRRGTSTPIDAGRDGVVDCSVRPRLHRSQQVWSKRRRALLDESSVHNKRNIRFAEVNRENSER